MMGARHPLPIAAALDWFRSSGPRTEARLRELIAFHCDSLAFPVTEEHISSAVGYCRSIGILAEGVDS